MKHFVVNAVGLIIAILIIPGCSANESDLYEKWENENREKWEQEAESDGYEKGYEEGFKDGEIEERSKYEEKEDQEEKDWDALFEQEREETRDLIRKYADEYDCLVWDDLEDFDFTIDLQNSAVGKKYAVMAYPTDIFKNADSIKMKAQSTILSDIFYLDIDDSLIDVARNLSYSDCVLIIQVENVLPMDVLDDYVEYYNVIDDSYVRVGDATISYDLSSEYRVISGYCEKIIQFD